LLGSIKELNYRENLKLERRVMADKLPFEIRLANAIQEYKRMFGVHPPTIGYEEGELYTLLLQSLKDKTELPGIEEKIKDVMDIDDDVLIDI
jgi:hypothetical protein|tara:strand:- start:259 stop:534 length:276 start_codon:yes stop_codon:yes gene_type:complete